MSEKIERIDYRCRISMNKEPFSEALVNYIKKTNDIGERDKVLSALSGYWLPFALKTTGNYSEEEVKQSARNAIYKLKLHIAYLSEVFLPDNTSANYSPKVLVQPTMPQTISNETVSKVASSEILKEPEPLPAIDVSPYQFDDMVETMF